MREEEPPTAAEERLYHVDGELVPASEATVSVDDRGFRYGDAAFETLRAYGGTIFEWDAHADRLERTCGLLGIDHGFTSQTLWKRIDETLAANGLADAYVRLSITRGVQPGKLTPGPAVDPTVVIWVKPLPRGGIDGASVWDGPATVRTGDTRRIPDAAVPARAKTHNYLNGILARLEGTDPGHTDEVLLFDTNGYLAEGTTSNVFLVEDGTLRTPSTDGPVLPGITRRVVLDLAADHGIPTEEGRYDSTSLDAADEVFLTNSTWEVRPVAQLDDRSVVPDERAGAPGGRESYEGEGGVPAAPETRWPTTRRLQQAFDEFVERQCY